MSSDNVSTGSTRRRQLVIVLRGAVGSAVDDLRSRWDPDVAARIPAHITLAYSFAENADATVASVASACPMFNVALSAPFAWQSGGGVAFGIVDLEGGLRRLLAELRGRGIATTQLPHVTIVHETTATRDPAAATAALAEARRLPIGTPIYVDALVTMDEDGSAWRQHQRHRLASVREGKTTER